MESETDDVNYWDSLDWDNLEHSSLALPLFQREMHARAGCELSPGANALKAFRPSLEHLIMGKRRNAENLFHAVPEGLTAARYHLERAKAIEGQILDLATEHLEILRQATGLQVSMTCPRHLDFEYHAFLLTVRRTLDYFAYGCSALFNESSSSFRRLAKTIDGRLPKRASSALVAVLNKETPLVEQLIGAAGKKTTRDKIAHTEYVLSGNVNLTIGNDGRLEVRIIGGGESVFPWTPTPTPVTLVTSRESTGVVVATLTPTLEQRLLSVERFLLMCYEALATAPAN